MLIIGMFRQVGKGIPKEKKNPKPTEPVLAVNSVNSVNSVVYG